MNTKDELIRHLRDNSGVLRDLSVAAAFEAIDRKDFVRADLKDEAYEDYALPLVSRQTISQPTTIAFMLEKLGAQPGEKVLDIGSGSGWTTALLAHIVGEKGAVVGVERLPELVALGQKNIMKYHFPHAKIHEASDVLGAPDEAPFDRILVSASALDDNVLGELSKQLQKNGTLVIPIHDSIWVIRKRKNGTVTKEEFPGFVFVPLIS